MKRLTVTSMALLVSMLLAACNAASMLPSQAVSALESAINTADQQAQEAVTKANEAFVQTTQAPPLPASEVSSLLAAYEGALADVYSRVSPSVVNIRVVQKGPAAGMQIPEIPGLPFNMPGMPGLPGAPDGPDSQGPQYSQGLGSGFVWNKDGYIVTNNHVVADADKIEITFADGTVAPAELIGADPYSDLAVVKVDLPADQLQPVKIADSKDVKVGQLAIAIGNPFGLEGTMTVGIISALGRTMPVGEGIINGPTYSMPDVIQTDAPINPGNSGGVLVNDQGQVIGVTFAIESPVRANAGIGFVIPSAIVQRVVPALMKDGKYVHPYLGISGMGLTPDLAKAMKLDAKQHGVLVGEVAPNGPADKAGLHGSSDEVEIDGQKIGVGGDVITAIEGQTVKDMDDLIAYLANSTEVGQTVELTILRKGDEQAVKLTLEARPSQAAEQPAETKGEAKAWLGISGVPVTADVAQAMELPADQSGVLVEQVQPGSPADQGGLRGGDQPFTDQGQQMLIGGDVIIAMDDQPITSMEGLRELLSGAQAGQEVTLTILRDGKQMTVQVTLGERPQ